jgi:hypothetical protein
MSVRPLRGLALVATSLALSISVLPANASETKAPSGSLQRGTHVQGGPGVALQRGTNLRGYRAKGVAAANWLASQLTKGRIHNGQYDYDDWGLTVDTALALVAGHDNRRDRARAAAAIERNYFDEYAAPGDERYAGAMAKTLLLTAVLRKDPRHFGGHNVRRQVLRLVADVSEGFEAGRLRDVSAFGDFSTTFTQAYGVLGLARTGNVPQDVVNYLDKQQCSDGYFRLTEVPGENCNQSGSGADVDATALAVQALLAADKAGAAVPGHSVSRAANWLVSVQRDNGSFRGGTATRGPNTNSTGLAAQALRAVGRDRARKAAAAYVASMQFTRKNTSGAAQRDIGTIAYNRAGLRNGLKNGIQVVERDQFRRATAQAIFALIPIPLNTMTTR